MSRKLIIIKLIISVVITSIYANNNYYYKSKQRIPLQEEGTISSSTIDYYITDKNILLGITEKLIVKLSITSEGVDKYLQEFNLTLEKSLGKNLYLLKTIDKSLTIDIANQLHEKEDVQYAHPDFIKQRLRR